MAPVQEIEKDKNGEDKSVWKWTDQDYIDCAQILIDNASEEKPITITKLGELYGKSVGFTAEEKFSIPGVRKEKLVTAGFRHHDTDVENYFKVADEVEKRAIVTGQKRINIPAEFLKEAKLKEGDYFKVSCSGAGAKRKITLSYEGHDEKYVEKQAEKREKAKAPKEEVAE